ncbi:hypothetical protein ABPG72_000886 [Tetrahymena utriculariae]
MKFIENWIKSKCIYYTLALSAIGVGIYGLTYRQISSGWQNPPFSWQDRPALVRTHFITGPIVLILGIFQFNQNLRLKHPSVHRWIGRIYTLSNLISTIVVFNMFLHSAFGLVTVISFFILNVLWLVSLVIAIYFIAIKKCIISHKYWMIRNYAITCSAITFRIVMGIFIPIFGLEIAYQLGASNCFFWNIILAELIIKKLKQMPNTNQNSPAQATQVANSDIIKGGDKSPQEHMDLQGQV